MDIVNETVKTNMLNVIADAISNNSSTNYIYFYDSITTNNDEYLAKIPFDRVAIEDDALKFYKSNNSKLGAPVDKDGIASKFRIPMHDDSNSDVLLGTVGLPIDFGADIKFNNLDWQISEIVTIESIKITMENVCLHQ